ncbi:histone acetyltransferase [Steccherinum ochraceum]|uniref:histone acetyltransferase n=1 Tax=Steccherinum ochraceum TaxID=92696 RepID=A0A4R0R8T2_9APHY|nr:histone acetyltransferase [Steccherinum ochraceum]
MGFKVLYPSSHDIPNLSEAALQAKIARHSPCSSCPPEASCHGLRPQTDFEPVLDSEYHQENLFADFTDDVFDIDETQPEYLAICSCGHSAAQHGADKDTIGSDEFARRGRVAVRLDELLEDLGRLLDFDYTDNDIESLRRQMRLPPRSPSRSPVSDLLDSMLPSSPPPNTGPPPLSPASSFLSDADPGEPPTKRRRVSYSDSSLSESSSSSSSEDEEEKPLAAKRAEISRGGRGKGGGPPRPRTGGKGAPGKKSKAHTAPAHIPPPTEEERAEMAPANGANGHPVVVKVEDKMDESQLTRLVTGVTVDAGGAASANPAVKAEKPSYVELRKGVIQIVPVENDGEARSLVILTGLKTLFQKQLPKMPREYIARLVYDTNSKCLAIIKRGYKVVGGICYRPFPHRGFAEIVFFATASVDQVKGYGGMLMDHFKAHIKNTYPDMHHFLTYADNYAVGYFRKQGFSKEISLDRSVWAGYIKDYEGGTIMQCTLLEKVDYLKTRDIIAQQREAILEKIREKSRSHIVYDGLDFSQWQNADGRVDPKDVPGLRESGWTSSMVALTLRPNGKNPERSAMEKLLSDLQGHPVAWAFLSPVNGEEVLDYYEVIKTPMDFSTMEHKLDTNQYPNLDAFVADARLVFENCRTYNSEGSQYHKNATKLERFMDTQLVQLKMKKDGY